MMTHLVAILVFFFAIMYQPTVGTAAWQISSASPVPRAPIARYATEVLHDLGGASGAHDLNAQGLIVGFASEPDSEEELPVVWHEGEVQRLAIPDGADGQAKAINDDGVIVGSVAMPGGERQAARWVDGEMELLDPLGGASSTANDIDSSGRSVGFVEDDGGVPRPVVWDERGARRLGTGAEPGGRATAINDSGQVAGMLVDSDGRTRAVMWQDGEIIELGPAGNAESLGMDISDDGVVVGTVTELAPGPDAEPFSQAVAWRDGEMRTLDAGEDNTCSYGLAINDREDLATTAFAGSCEGPQQARLVVDGTTIAIEPFAFLSRPVAIDGRGTVVGYANFDDVRPQAVRWNPVPSLVALPARDDGGMWAAMALPALGNDAEAWDLNASGTIVGCVEHADSGIDRPAVWRDGELKLLETLGGRGGTARGINDAGVIVGQAENSDGELRPAMWVDDRVTDLGTLGGPEGGVIAINEAGQIAGWAENAQDEPRAVLWDDGDVIDLGTMDEPQGRAIAIGDDGQVVVMAASMATYLWQDGVVTELTADQRAIAVTIGDDGTLAGWMATGGDEGCPAVWVDGVPTCLGEAAAIEAVPTDLVDRDLVVGIAVDAEYDTSRAVLWRNGTWVELAMSTGLGMSESHAVNDRGLVVGTMLGFGRQLAVVWIPVELLRG